MDSVKTNLVGAFGSSISTLSRALSEEDIEGSGSSYRIVLPWLVLLATIFTLALSSGWIRKLAVAVLDIGAKRREKSKEVPPGSLGLPMVGDSLRYVNAYYNMTIKSYVDEKIRKYGPVFKVSLMGSPSVFLDAPAGTKIVLSHNEMKWTKGWWPKPVRELLGKHALSSQYGDEYLLHRNLVMKNFLDIDVVHQYISTMEKKAVKHIDKYWLALEDGSEVKAFKLMNVFSFSLITQLILGISNEKDIIDFNEVFHDMAAGLMALPVNLPGFQYWRSLRSRKLINQMLNVHIEKRRQDLKAGRASPTQDLLSVLLSTPNSEGHFLTSDELCDSLLQLVFGGHDTTAAMLTLSLRLIKEDPAVYEELKQGNFLRDYELQMVRALNAFQHATIAASKKPGELLTKEDLWAMKYTWRVMQEVMRLYPANQVMFREARITFEHHGYTIPKGWKLCFTNANSSWDPKFCKDPEKFKPSRFNEDKEKMPPWIHFPFGAGHRICPGQDFARVELLIFLHHFLRKIDWTVLVPNEKIEYRLLATPVNGTPIKITKIRC
ncbi:hypothetical protein AXG93_4645s1000 [Marchantia polymorpha subsp. ruderalis]|uniref:Cytochrome P450 n=1 Tax=Marchantia polymorpha subsp. ruderalis TaxID=1480154 RepID=A0A176WND5_MARPO|nr:hypothetical protein AXG93_4645s1000 [Marchantia polymorpha subsp. ruderalis]